MNKNMQFRTQIPILKSGHAIDYDAKVVSFGSCFAINMAEKFNYFKFRNTCNPFGILLGGAKVASADATFGCEFGSDFRRQGVSFEACLCSPNNPFGKQMGGAQVASADATFGCESGSVFRRQGVSFEAYLGSPDSPFGKMWGAPKLHRPMQFSAGISEAISVRLI